MPALPQLPQEVNLIQNLPSLVVGWIHLKPWRLALILDPFVRLNGSILASSLLASIERNLCVDPHGGLRTQADWLYEQIPTLDRVYAGVDHAHLCETLQKGWVVAGGRKLSFQRALMKNQHQVQAIFLFRHEA